MEQTSSEIVSSSSTISQQFQENEIKKRPYPDDISSGCQEGSETVQAVQEMMLSLESPKKKRRNCNSSGETNCFPVDITLCREACIDGDSPHSAVIDTDTNTDGSVSTLIEESMQKCLAEKIEIVDIELNNQLVSEKDDHKPRAKISSSLPGGLPNSSIVCALTSSTDSSPISGSAKNTGATSGQDLPKDGHSDNQLKETECYGNGSIINSVTNAACCQEDKTSSSSSLLDQSLVCSGKGNAKTNEHRSKKLLILDVNGLLADILSDPEPGYVVDTWFAMKAVFKRTFCNDFIEFCFDNFNVGIWSSRNRKNVERIVDFLIGENKKKLLFCWNQAHCTNTGYGTARDKSKPLFLKEIKKLWDKEDPDLPWEKGDYDESNTLLMDDSPHKALRNPLYTAIFPYPYVYKDNTDTLLGPKGKLRLYLKRLVEAEHVQRFVEANPYGQKPITERDAYWPYYSKILNSTGSSETEKKGNDDKPNEPKTVIKDAKLEPGRKALSEPEKKGDDDRPVEPKPDINDVTQEPGKNRPSEPEKKDADDRSDEPKSDIKDVKQEPGEKASSEPEKKGDDDRPDEPKPEITDVKQEPGINSPSEPKKKDDDYRSDEPKPDIKDVKQEPGEEPSSEPEKKGDDDMLDEPKPDIKDAKQEPGNKASSEPEKNEDDDRSDEPNKDIKLEPLCEATTTEVTTRVAIAEDPMGSSD